LRVTSRGLGDVYKRQALTSQGLTGSIFYMVNHGFSTAALFLTAGWMIKRRGSSQIADFGGLQRITPVLAWSFFLAGMSALALPGLSSFISEFLVLVGTFAKYPVAAILGTTGIILAALYVLIAVQKSLHGEAPSTSTGMADLNLREKIAIAPVIVVLVVLGFYPKPVLSVINPTTQTVMTNAGVSDPIAKVAK
jgi:NADH-quinone oxidoreductase subunit M